MQSIQIAITTEIETQLQSALKNQYAETKKELTKIKRLYAEQKKAISSMQKLIGELMAAREKTTPRKVICRVSKQSLGVLKNRLGVTATELARLLGVTLQTVSRWEHGKLNFSRKAKERIAELRLLGKRAVRQRLLKLNTERYAEEFVT